VGLDAYWKVKRTPEEMATQLLKGEEIDQWHEFGYHRKFHDLNEFMGNYAENSDYNCENIEVTESMLNALAEWNKKEAFIKYAWEKHTEDEDGDNDLNRFILQAKQYLKDGREVVYMAWW
jgi:hypothetical protein